MELSDAASNFKPISLVKYLIDQFLWEKFISYTRESEAPFGGAKLNDWAKGILPFETEIN